MGPGNLTAIDTAALEISQFTSWSAARGRVVLRKQAHFCNWRCGDAVSERAEIFFLKSESFMLGVDVFGKCGQCDEVSWCKETLGGHFKAIHFALEVCDIWNKVDIFVWFLSVPVFNILLSWARELKQVDGFCLVVHNHNVVPQSSGGIEPPPGAVYPGKSLLNVNMNVIDEKYGNSHRNTNIRPE